MRDVPEDVGERRMPNRQHPHQPIGTPNLTAAPTSLKVKHLGFPAEKDKAIAVMGF